MPADSLICSGALLWELSELDELSSLGLDVGPLCSGAGCVVTTGTFAFAGGASIGSSLMYVLGSTNKGGLEIEDF